MEQDWRLKLTPYDTELAIMVESLTEKPCQLKRGNNSYFFEADYEKHPEPEYILAIWDAIEGRIGKRLLEIKDNAERHALFVSVAFSDEDYPAIVRLDRDGRNCPKAGGVYCRKLSEIRAVQVNRNNPDVVLEFVGNGEFEIPKVGPVVFHFINNGVFAHAPEGTYIVYTGRDRFEIVDQETFEKEYESK